MKCKILQEFSLGRSRLFRLNWPKQIFTEKSPLQIDWAEIKTAAISQWTTYCIIQQFTYSKAADVSRGQSAGWW